MDIVRKYFPAINPEKLQQFQQFQESIICWNQRINLISRKDIDHLAERHVLHSLAIARYVHFKSGDTILDVGTGGGFPGIPLAIFFPDAQFTLIDSIGKKVNAVKQIIRSLNIDNVNCLQVRAENYPSKARYVVSRAVTRLDRFTGWVKNKIDPPSGTSLGNGIYYLKGGALQEEISAFKNVTIHPLSEIYSEPYFEGKKLLYLPYHSLH
jgi:16S rRNA (guanine527-N7)-methyltransferase